MAVGVTGTISEVGPVIAADLTATTPTARRGGVAALASPLVTLAGAATATAYVAAVDPNRSGHYPECPFLYVTGWWCPGCGGLRAAHALANGDVMTAVSRNILFVAMVPLLVAMWVRWAHDRWVGGERATLAPAAFVWAVGAVVVGFAVARNLPFARALAP